MITDPQIKRFCNEQVRQAADRFGQLYNWCRAVRDEWTAQDMGTAIPNTTEVIDDGADFDGRPIITGADVHAIKDRVLELITLMEATSNEKLNEVLRVAVNPTRGILQ
ncbi:hypothetical protein LCGC14_0643560 [marine sediment metagenome]|uniref:Uncharacterized protein n=1 Tax=marine sediment metagenome TaxID=412755 RepID=A0A0F9QYM2_9ZZZZ